MPQNDRWLIIGYFISLVSCKTEIKITDNYLKSKQIFSLEKTSI
jgi:hypothetical protein